MLPYNPDAPLSAHYKLSDLTLTNQNLTEPNMPTEAYMFDNLILLADELEELEAVIGPFMIISAYRTKELQQKLAAEGEPTGTGTISFHEAGRAVDIAPTTMSLAEYFGKILANDDLRAKFAEIAIKNSQGALHLSLNVPGDVREPKVLGLTDDNSYGRLTADEIANYAAPYLQAAGETAEEIYNSAVAIASGSGSKAPLFLALGAGLLTYFFMFRRKTA